MSAGSPLLGGSHSSTTFTMSSIDHRVLDTPAASRASDFKLTHCRKKGRWLRLGKLG